MSQDARALATQTGIMPLLEELIKFRPDSRTLSVDSRPASLDSRPAVLALKQAITESLLATTYEVRSICNRIDRELSDTNQVLAYEAERRDKAVRLNTYANFLSGGVSGIIRGSLKLGDIDNIPPEVIETTEGSIQTSLASWALYQQHGDRRLEQSLPNTLAQIMVTGGARPQEFPESVWNYLNSPGEKSKVTRRLKLLERWRKLNMCLIHAGHREATHVRAARVAGTMKTQTINIAVLQDRVAMLTELRTTVLEMDNLLLEIMQAARGQREII